MQFLAKVKFAQVVQSTNSLLTNTKNEIAGKNANKILVRCSSSLRTNAVNFNKRTRAPQTAQ